MEFGMITNIAFLFVGLGLGIGAFIAYQKMQDDKKRIDAKKEADRIVNKAKSKANRIEKDAKNKAKDFENRARRNAEQDIKKQKQKVSSQEHSLKDKEKRMEKDYRQKEERLEASMRELDAKAEEMTVLKDRIASNESKLTYQIEELTNKLESIANYTSDEARRELMGALEKEAKEEAAEMIQEIESEAKKEANKKARYALAVAVSRYASEVSTERTTSSIPLKGEEMKGKIIGREGRNIRALEAACGVDLIIDETPETVIISSFDAVRREIARLSLKRLMEDGRVHPGRIEEVVSKVKSELFENIKEEGEKACFDLGVHGVNPKLVNLIGELKYRHAESQNLLSRSVEVANICGLIGAEIGFDVNKAKRAGLLHTVGRALDHTYEGSYAKAGADFARRHGEKEEICQAILNHNSDQDPSNVLGHIVQAAHNLARSRPGAKRMMMENYIKRLEDLESVANSFDGVSRTFAIQAGKEIRVLVDSGKVTDEQSAMLSRDIARKIQKELSSSGQVKVNVIRETRIVEHAR
ncbi:MAG: ribonuclease Y [Pseudomonadota bacterium]